MALRIVTDNDWDRLALKRRGCCREALGERFWAGLGACEARGRGHSSRRLTWALGAVISRGRLWRSRRGRHCCLTGETGRMGWGGCSGGARCSPCCCPASVGTGATMAGERSPSILRRGLAIAHNQPQQQRQQNRPMLPSLGIKEIICRTVDYHKVAQSGGLAVVGACQDNFSPRQLFKDVN